MNTCPRCGGAVTPGQRFCGGCGAPLGASCPGCGAPVQPGQRFCSECGAPLEAAAPAAPAPEPAAEVRLVSVLFVDLVGFTPLSETRDAEDMRELLSGYFAVARQVVADHGGSIEKFIGDAVMAVWGAPLAHEDDAVRAVRAGLELVAAVAAYGERVGVGLRARGGIATGRAASWASSSEGLVVGDRVNTAARVQSAAEPGGVLVDQLTREASIGSIEYRDLGLHQLKGKSEAMALWEAVSALGEEQSSRAGREPGATYGRDRELVELKELFHATLEQSQARLALISGTAGVGKTRVLDELTHYLQSLPTTVLWHQAGCTTHGAAVAYGALSRLVRQRLRILESDDPQAVASKMEEGLLRYLPSAGDREFVGPKLAVLLGLPGPDQTPARDEFFAAWRLFLASLAQVNPVVLAIENLHWADSGLLDFIDYLLEGCAQLPVLVLGMARPELLQRRPAWGEGRANATPVALGRLSDSDIGRLLDDLVPTMPSASHRQIVERAEGIPLYAVETVNMLTDRGLVVERDGVRTLAEELTELDTPVSLEALIAARLDELDLTERVLIKDLAVLGLTFSRESVEAVSTLDQDRVEGLLDSLVRKGVLVEEGIRSGRAHGYAFSQTLLRAIAYDRLGKRERRARHLAVAVHLRSQAAAGGEEVAESVGAHYREAYLLDRGFADAEQTRGLALEWLERGAQRAAAVGAPERAESLLLQASELAVAETDLLRLREAAAQMAYRSGRVAESLQLWEELSRTHLEAGRETESARLAGKIGSALGRMGRASEASQRLRQALQVLDQGQPGPEVAEICSQLARELSIAGSGEEALPYVERALQLAARWDLPQVLCDSLETKALVLRSAGEAEEALALFEQTIEIAGERGLASEELLSGHANSADTRMASDLPEATDHLEAALTIARRLGQRYSETFLAGNLMLAQIFQGEWADAEQLARVLLADEGHGQEILHSRLALLYSLRGEPALARQELSRLGRWKAHDSREPRTLHAALEGTVLLAEGDAAAALAASRAALEIAIPSFGLRHEIVRQAWPDACQAALELLEWDQLQQLIGQLDQVPGPRLPPYLRAQQLRFRALASRDGEDPGALFETALALFRELGYPYWSSRTVVDWASWNSGHGLPALPPGIEEARERLAELGLVL